MDATPRVRGNGRSVARGPARGPGRRSAPSTAGVVVIYIVDDDQSVRTSLTRLFRSVGYEVQAFADAEEFLGQAAGDETAASCMILDLLGRASSGLDLQEVINRREPRVPVIVLTGCEDPELLGKALMAGAIKVLRKP